MAAASPTAGAAQEIRNIFAEKAATAGVVLDDDDQIIVEQAAATAAIIAQFDLDITQRGAVIAGSQGGHKTNPSATEVRQQRVALARLMTVVDARIQLASTGARPAGVQPGSVRGVYAGDGTQNQARDAERAARGGKGSMRAMPRGRRA